MTVEDVLKFCEKGNHKYQEWDIVKSIGLTDAFYIIMKCDECPSRWVKDFVRN